MIDSKSSTWRPHLCSKCLSLLKPALLPQKRTIYTHGVPGCLCTDYGSDRGAQHSWRWAAGQPRLTVLVFAGLHVLLLPETTYSCLAGHSGTHPETLATRDHDNPYEIPTCHYLGLLPVCMQAVELFGWLLSSVAVCMSRSLQPR